MSFGDALFFIDELPVLDVEQKKKEVIGKFDKQCLGR